MFRRYFLLCSNKLAATSGGGGIGAAAVATNTSTSTLLTSVQGLLSGSRWTPLPAIAKQLSDDQQEELGEEYGGLKKYLELNSQHFELVNEGGFKAKLKGVEEQMASLELPRAPKVNSFPRAPPVSASSSSKVGGASTSSGGKKAVHILNLSMAEEQRASHLLGDYPTYFVPLTAVAERLQVSLEEAAETAIRNRKMLDLVNCNGAVTELPSTLPSTDTTSSLSTSTSEEVTSTSPKKSNNFYQGLYIRVSPPYAEIATRNGNGDYDYLKHKSPETDALRVARYLTTMSFTPFSTLAAQCMGMALAKPLLHVVLAHQGTFFELKRGGGDGSASSSGDDDGKKVEQDDGSGAVTAASPSSSSTSSAAAGAGGGGTPPLVDLSIKFLLDPANSEGTKCPQGFEEMTLEQVKTWMKEKKKELNSGGSSKAFKYIKFKRRGQQAIMFKKYPHGTPFFDRRVLAYFLYDLLPDESITLQNLRDILPQEFSEDNPITSKFIERFPNLFFQYTDSGDGSLMIQKAELPRPNIDDMSLEDIAIVLLNGLPHFFDPDRPISFSMMGAHIPIQAKAQLKRIGYDAVFNAFPQWFKLATEDKYSTKGERYVYVIGSFAEEMRAKKMEKLKANVLISQAKSTMTVTGEGGGKKKKNKKSGMLSTSEQDSFDDMSNGFGAGLQQGGSTPPRASPNPSEGSDQESEEDDEEEDEEEGDEEEEEDDEMQQEASDDSKGEKQPPPS